MKTLTHAEAEESFRRTRAVYESKLRDLVDTPENLGRILVFDLETADYEIGDDPAVEATAKLQARHPGVRLKGVRIGYKTGETFGGMRERDTR